jgi:hypothetical protein
LEPTVEATMPRATRPAKPASSDALVAELIARFDYDGVSRRIVESFLLTIPGYARMPDSVMMGQILGIVRHNLELFVRCLREDREPNDAELAVLRESATQRGREGLPLQDMLHGYRLGARVAWRSLTEQADSAAEREVLLDIADRIMTYIDGISSAVSQAYLDEREHLVSEQERWARALMDGLLDASTPLEDLRRLSDKTGLGLAERYRPLATCVVDGATREHSRHAITLRTKGVIALTEGDRVCGLAPVDVAESALARPDAALAVGSPTPRDRLASGLDFARLQVTTARSLGRTGTIGPDDLLLELLLARSPELAESLRARVLGPLEEYAERRSPELLQTLAAYVEAGLDRRAAADGLSVHANTLDYRIRRIEELTGLRLADPEDLALAVLALKQSRLDGRP